MNDRRRRDEDFVRNVLDRTSGSPCERAAGMIPDLVDHTLEGLDRQLVQAHLEHCPGCRALAVTLGWLNPLLPSMAVLDPGPDFTAAVLARTTGAATAAEKAVRGGATIGPAGLMDRLGRWWQQQILKPQFAMQFAYVATVVLVLLTALPVSPLRGTPEKALQVMQAGPGAIPFLATTGQWLNGRSEAVTGAIEGKINSRWQAVAADLAQRRDRSSEPRAQLSAHLAEAIGRLRAGEPGQVGYELIQTAHSVHDAWNSWWRAPPPDQNGNN
jgi:hypothetical protein